MAKAPTQPKRRNRAVSVADAIAGALDPVLKKRGFASRDILEHWRAMAPKPYDGVSIPDKLVWPRGERSADGATLYLRCQPGHALMVAHQAPAIAAAVNRYFGYVLVGQVRLSAEPFSSGSAPKAQPAADPSPIARARVGAAVADVADEGVREALRLLGLQLAAQGETKRK
ncbi:MAG: hypothetical protein JWR39_907 [Devosia sp.]|jgi:hypothetical protein|nr:hypothetical protein [Devosia sp.]